MGEFEASIEIEEACIALKMIADELIEHKAIGKAVVTFEIVALELRDSVVFNGIGYPMLHKCASDADDRAAILIRPENGKDLANTHVQHIAGLTYVDYGRATSIANNDIVRCEHLVK